MSTKRCVFKEIRGIRLEPKLVSKVNVPNTTEYRLDEIAQSNLFKYKEDDTVKGLYDGVINVNDKTLDAEREAYTSIFAGTDEYGKTVQ